MHRVSPQPRARGHPAAGHHAWRAHHVGRALSDYLDAVVRPGAAASFAHALPTALLRKSEWHHATLSDLPDDSVMLLAPRLDGCRERVVACDACPFVDLEASLPVPEGRARELEYLRRRAARHGLHVRRVQDEAEAHRTLDDLVRLHEERWRAHGRRGVLSESRVQRFHHLALGALHRAGIARMYRLQARDRCIAVLYGLAGNRRICFYLSGFDPEARSLAPGTLLIGHALDDARAERKRYFDFLRGREPYKYAWGARDRTTWLRQVERGSEEETSRSWRSSECGGPSAM